MTHANTIAPELLPPRLPVLGHIKIGAKVPGKVHPTKLDHFRVTKRDRGTDGNFALDTDVHAVVGDKPKELEVRLPFDTRPENFYAKMLEYRGRTRAVECNGVTRTEMSTRAEGTCSRRAGRSCACKPYARLGVVLEAAPTFGGLYVFRTTSWETANSLQTALAMFERQFGTLRGLPLKMRLYPAEVRYQDGGKEKTATAYKVALVLRADYETAQRAALEFHRGHQIARRELLQLSRGTTEDLATLDDTDAGEIDDEFFTRGGDSAAPSSSPAASKLADMNRAIVGGPGADDQIAELVTEVRTLIDQAQATGEGLKPKSLARLEEALESRDESHLRASIAWLTDRITGKDDDE